MPSKGDVILAWGQSLDQSAEVEKASNLCQPRIKVDILQIFTLFHTAPVKAVQMGGRGFVVSHASSEYTLEMVESHTYHNKSQKPPRQESCRGRLLYHRTWRSQTNCTTRQAMHKWGYASPKIQVYAKNKHKSGTEMDLAIPQNAQTCTKWTFSWKQGNIVGCVILCTYPGDLLLAPSNANALSSEAPTHP